MFLMARGVFVFLKLFMVEKVKVKVLLKFHRTVDVNTALLLLRAWLVGGP